MDGAFCFWGLPMPVAIQWSDTMNDTLLTMRAAGATWDAVAVCLGVCRRACIAHGHRLGATIMPRVRTAAAMTPAEAARAHLPLEAGHPVSWGILCALTPSLQG